MLDFDCDIMDGMQCAVPVLSLHLTLPHLVAHVGLYGRPSLCCRCYVHYLRWDQGAGESCGKHGSRGTAPHPQLFRAQK